MANKVNSSSQVARCDASAVSRVGGCKKGHGAIERFLSMLAEAEAGRAKGQGVDKIQLTVTGQERGARDEAPRVATAFTGQCESLTLGQASAAQQLER